jgi:hypothetical protein
MKGRERMAVILLQAVPKSSHQLYQLMNGQGRRIIARHPDEFLIDPYHLDGEMVVHELHQQGATLRTPYAISKVLADLEMCECSQFAQTHSRNASTLNR